LQRFGGNRNKNSIAAVLGVIFRGGSNVDDRAQNLLEQAIQKG